MAPESVTTWLAGRTTSAPDALRRRVEEWVDAGAAETGTRVEVLTDAATRALDAVVHHSGDRSAALDLLAADALITLALLHQAEHGPNDLGRFAASLVAAPLEPTGR